MNDTARGIGDNFPPKDLKEDIEGRYHDTLNQVAELLDVAATVPDQLDDETQPKCAELIKKIRFIETTLDGARKLEKEPFDQGVKLINGLFNTRIEKLEAARKTLNERSQAYLEKKAAAERRRLEEEEEKRREKAAADLAAAQEAERKKREAEEAQRKAEEETRRAQEARERAMQEQKDAEDRAAKAKIEEARLKALALERAAEDARRLKEKQERDAEEQAKRDEQKRLEDAAMLEAKNMRWMEEQAAAKAKAEAAKALEERRNAEEATRVAKAEVKTAGRDEREAMDSALREEKRADKIADVVAGPEAKLARTRSEHGAVSTLSRKWTCEIRNRDLLDKEALWPFINGEALEAALWKWMMAQAKDKRMMGGAIMQEETIGQIR